MLFKIDESLPLEAATLLWRSGHDAATVFDESLQGSPDTAIAAACLSEQRALVTLDLDFADIRSYPPEKTPGCIVLRLSRLDKVNILKALDRIMPILEQEQLRGRLWIVNETQVRIRGVDAPQEEDEI